MFFRLKEKEVKSSCFFFQAEDGIRDYKVTGVQTCALPISEELGEAAADTESWIKFDTSVGRGLGHLRLRDGKAWTLLTTLNELKGHEEPKRDRRSKGVEHGAVPN